MAEAQALQVRLFVLLCECCVLSTHACCQALFNQSRDRCAAKQSLLRPPAVLQARMQRHMARNQAMTEAMQAAAQQVGGLGGCWYDQREVLMDGILQIQLPRQLHCSAVPCT